MWRSCIILVGWQFKIYVNDLLIKCYFKTHLLRHKFKKKKLKIRLWEDSLLVVDLVAFEIIIFLQWFEMFFVCMYVCMLRFAYFGLTCFKALKFPSSHFSCLRHGHLSMSVEGGGTLIVTLMRPKYTLRLSTWMHGCTSTHSKCIIGRFEVKQS